MGNASSRSGSVISDSYAGKVLQNELKLSAEQVQRLDRSAEIKETVINSSCNMTP